MLRLEVLEARDTPTALGGGDCQPDPDAGLELLKEIKAAQAVALAAAVGGPLAAVPPAAVDPTLQLPFLPSDALLPNLDPVKP